VHVAGRHLDDLGPAIGAALPRLADAGSDHRPAGAYTERVTRPGREEMTHESSLVSEPMSQSDVTVPGAASS
jgi:hypothetical protein